MSGDPAGPARTTNGLDPRAEIAAGPGVVGRFGASIVVFQPPPDEHEPFTSGLLERVARWSVDTEPPEAATVAWDLAGLLSAHHASAPDWGAAIRVGGGYLVLLHGSVRALLDTAEARLELTGQRAATWVEHLAQDPVARIALTLSTVGEVIPDPRSDLCGGVVPGASGLVLTERPAAPSAERTGRPAATAGRPPTGGRTWPGSAPVPAPSPAPSLAGLGGASIQRPAPPTAGLTAVTEADTTARAGAPVDDIRPPQVAVPSRAEETQVITTTVNALVADDGTRTLLDRNYVFGREPQQDPAVARGHPSPIVVRDPDNMVSRVQVYVTVGGALVTLQDAGSANGTFVAAPGAAAWSPIGPGPVVLPQGWSMRLGRRVFTHLGPGEQPASA